LTGVGEVVGDEAGADAAASTVGAGEGEELTDPAAGLSALRQALRLAPTRTAAKTTIEVQFHFGENTENTPVAGSARQNY